MRKNENGKFRFLFVILVFEFLFITTLMATSENVTTPPTTTEITNEGVTKDAIEKEKEVGQQMQIITRQIGVTCVYCHNQDNYKSDEKAPYKIAKKHMNTVRLLNEEVFTERDKGGSLLVQADCYMCHRGLSTPKYKEPPQNLLK